MNTTHSTGGRSPRKSLKPRGGFWGTMQYTYKYSPFKNGMSHARSCTIDAGELASLTARTVLKGVRLYPAQLPSRYMPSTVRVCLLSRTTTCSSGWQSGRERAHDRVVNDDSWYRRVISHPPPLSLFSLSLSLTLTLSLSLTHSAPARSCSFQGDYIHDTPVSV